ncbi:heparan-alpha-glucosaminide N-acetyltransferase domain-containing protein [Aestuariivivens sediminicola]|uniref:heparan-alpha-glucosaminide N-acetyltransferase domain-containing protein n=1 Tax=Aestuariivivens sediminicola TaxID=2913560 RepID=UPI001F570EB5|nr:heparan-alpha-glucosaminide N-acetyltransferase domain-containing protein [Aestuariivivens sediminicola]
MQTIRLYFIDTVRAFAILMMLQGHFIDTLIDPIFRDPSNTMYSIWLYFRGITAPTFFTISGLVFMYLLLRAYAKGDDAPRIRKGLNRGFLLIAIGYSLRINLVGWLTGHFNYNFLAVDVLQCIGVSLIMLVGLHILLKKYSYTLSTVLAIFGTTCFLTEPLYRNLVLPWLPLFLENYLSKSHGSVFTLLPWLGYTAYGAWLATVFFRHVNKSRFKLLTIITFLGVGLLLIYYSSWFLIKLYHITGYELLQASANYNYLFTRFGNVLILFACFYTFERFLKQSLITKIGQKTLSIYVIHFILIYGSYTGYGLKRYLSKSLTPTEAILGALGFIVLVCFISFHYAKTNAFLYGFFGRLFEKLKHLFKLIRH